MFRKWLAEKIYPEFYQSMSRNGLRAYEEGYNAHKKEIADSLKSKNKTRQYTSEEICQMTIAEYTEAQLNNFRKPVRKYTKKAKNV